MSDSNAAPQPQPGPERAAARSMADIARLFLDGARPTPPSGAPRRTSPRDRTAAPPLAVPDALAEPVNAHGGESQAAPRPAPLALPHLSLALVDLADRAAAGQLAIAAAALAQQHDTSICVLSLQQSTFTIDMLGVKSPASLPVIRPAGASPDLQIARALFTLRHAAGHWIVAAPSAEGPDFALLAAAIHDWLLVSTSANDVLIAAYGRLKRACSNGAVPYEPRIVVLDDHPARAAAVHARLSRAARQFLRTDIHLAAVAAPAPGEMVSPLRVADIALPPGEGDRQGIYATILDELCGTSSDADAPVDVVVEPALVTSEAAAALLPPEDVLAVEAVAACPAPPPPPCTLDDSLDFLADSAADVALQAHHSAAAAAALVDHLAAVLDPEERAALVAALPDAEPDLAAGPVEKTLTEPVPVETSAPFPATAPAPALTPGSLCAIPLPDPALPARPAQWRAVEASIPALVPGSTILDARAPMAWAAQSCLAVEPAASAGGGTLHVWTLYQDGASWFALREWAAEHKNLLALTQRDLPLDSSAPVLLHIVLPLDGAAPADISSLLRTAPPNLHLYRLRTLHYQSHPALIVVPLA